MNSYFVEIGQGESGPHGADELQEMLRMGKITGGSQCRYMEEGTPGDWSPLSDWATVSQWMVLWNAKPQTERDRLSAAAGSLGTVSMIAFALCGAAVITAFIVDKEFVWLAAASVSGFFGVATFMAIIGQLLHIRAALERKR